MAPLLQIVAINLWPVAGVAWFGGSVLTLLLLYWIENLILGAINVLKMLIEGGSGGWGGLILAAPLAAFFCFHYGFFCYVHGMLIWGFFGGPAAHAKLAALGVWGATWQRVSAHRVLFWNVLLMAAFHVYAFLRYWVGKQAWIGTAPPRQMAEPYPRIIVVHFTVLLGGFLVMLLHQPILAVVVLGLLKTAIETGHLRLVDALTRRPPPKQAES
jgi:hypothetical protein